MKTTKNQKTALAYFAAIADKQPRPNFNHDPRTVRALLDAGLLAVVETGRGNRHGITDAGRAALEQ